MGGIWISLGILRYAVANMWTKTDGEIMIKDRYAMYGRKLCAVI